MLATIIEYRNLESGEHIRRTSMLTRIMIMQMLTKQKYRNTLLTGNYNSMIKATALHDIGKIGISDTVLLKPGRLTDEEFETMKEHSIIGRQIVDSIAGTLPDDDMYLKYCREICNYHHEQWDGGGYPEGLKGEEIPLSARILSIVDVYDALVNTRCYKPPFSHEDALKIITDSRGKQFDPDLVDILLEVSGQFRDLEETLRD